MPLMHVTYTKGAIPPERVRPVTEALMDVVLRHHIAAKLREQLIPVFRVRLAEVEPRLHLTGGRELGKPVYDVDLIVPAGSLEGGRKDDVVREITEALLAEEGTPWDEEEASRVWIIIRDVPDGKWAVGGVTVTARSILERLLRMRMEARRRKAVPAPRETEPA